MTTTHRLSDLLGTRVLDADGNDLGVVHDVVAVQDGPVELGFGESLRVGGNGFASRLGYGSGDLKGPWALKVLFRWLLRRGMEVPWSAVARWDGDTLHLSPEWSGSPTGR